MSNPNLNISTIGNSYSENISQWYDKVILTYRKEDTVNGTNESDSLGTQIIKFKVPSDYIATLVVSLTVDDWGELDIFAAEDTSTSLLHLGMMEGIDGEAGVRGGHAQWSKTGTVSLTAGDYLIHITQRNATYVNGYENKAKYNVSYCKARIDATKMLTNFVGIPSSIAVDFHTVGDPVDKNDSDAKGNSYCASGYVFLGTAVVSYRDDTENKRSFAVQTGGWMNSDSRFYADNLHPTQAQVNSGNYDPKNYPDTCFPAYPSQVLCTVNAGTASEKTLYLPIIKTTRGGNTVDGFRTPVPDECRRSNLMLHAKERYGSEGCISTGDPNWEDFCSDMARALASGVVDIPITVVYTTETQPNLTRKLA